MTTHNNHPLVPSGEDAQNRKAREAQRKAKNMLLANVMVLLEEDDEMLPKFHYRDGQGLPLCGSQAEVVLSSLADATDDEAAECLSCVSVSHEMAKGWG